MSVRADATEQSRARMGLRRSDLEIRTCRAELGRLSRRLFEGAGRDDIERRPFGANAARQDKAVHSSAELDGGLCHVGLRPAPDYAMSLLVFRAGHRYYYSARLQERRDVAKYRC
jgi:hypothetical protein